MSRYATDYPVFPRSAVRILCTGMVLVSLGLIAGCAVGPNFQKPVVQTPAAWADIPTTATSGATAFTSATLATWWSTFDDPELTTLIRRGIESNLDVALAVQRVRQARAVVGETKGGLWPSLNASAQADRSYTHAPIPKSAQTPGGPNSTVNYQNLYQGGFDAVWELDVFGGQRRAVEASRADLQSSEENLRDALVTLTAEIGVDYLNLRGLQEQLRVARENVAAQSHSTDITKQRFRVGFASALDLASAEAQVATTQAQIPTLQSSISQTIYQLSVLLGESPEALLAELSPDKPLPTLPPQIPTGLPSDLLARRPDIHGAEAQLHAAVARIGVAKANLYPQFSLTGSLRAQANQLDTWSRSVTRSWSVGPAVNWNLFNGGQTRSLIEENKALAQQSLIQYKQTILTAFQEVENARVAFARQIERTAALETAVQKNRQALKLANELYSAGQENYVTVLVAEQSLYNTENSLSVSRSQTAQSLVSLYKALGGGWDEATYRRVQTPPQEAHTKPTPGSKTLSAVELRY